MSVNSEALTPLAYLLGIVQNESADDDARFRAAVAAAPYCHPRIEKATQSKKDELAERSREAAIGSYAPPSAPKLVVNNE